MWVLDVLWQMMRWAAGQRLLWRWQVRSESVAEKQFQDIPVRFGDDAPGPLLTGLSHPGFLEQWSR